MSYCRISKVNPYGAENTIIFLIYKDLFSENVTVEFTKKHSKCWFLIENDGDESECRYSYNGDILTGIYQYINLINHIQKRDENYNESRNRRFKKIRK